MENQSAQPKNVMITYGVILGVLSVIFALIYYVLGKTYEQDSIRSILSFVLSAVVIFLGLKKFKELNNGYLTIGQAIKTGLGIAMISGLISVIYTVLFMTVIEPEYVNNVVEVSRQAILEKYPDFSDEQLEQALDMTRKFSSPGMMAGIILLFSAIFGFIISLIEGLILKNNPETV